MLQDPMKPKSTCRGKEPASFRPSKLAESISKPINLPSLRRKTEAGEAVTVASGPSNNEITVDEVVTQPLILDSMEIYPTIEQEQEMAGAYVELLRQEGELLTKWRQLIMKNSQ